MIISCGYKADESCKYHKKKIVDVENEMNIKCLDNCNNAVVVYKDKDKVHLLYEAYKDANKEKNASEVLLMRAIYGHSSAVKDDYDYLYYQGYTLWMVLHKKYKYISHYDILHSFECMQQMNMKIPKRVRREVRRIKKKLKRSGEDIWWY